MNCLLPIEWLELLETGDQESMEEHLDSCPSCRSIVESLRANAAEEAFSSDWISTVDLSSSPQWALSDPDQVRAGQIWLTRESFQINKVSYSNVDRVFVLVLDDPVEEYNWQWVNVAPVLTDTDSATSTDLLLSADQTTLDVPVAAYLRYQTILMRNQLDACIGDLTEAGQEVLQTVKAGSFDEARFGAQLESPNDIRLARTDFLQTAVDQLGAVYTVISSADLAASEEATEHPSSERDVREAIEGAYERFKGHIARIYELKPSIPPPEQLSYQTRLAASTEADVNPLARYFSIRKDDVELAGTLELIYHERGADLTFWFRAVRGLPEHVRIVLCVIPHHGQPIASPAVEPQRDTAVVIASGAAVLPIEVGAVKVKLDA
jgi:hypothetical protein